MKHSNQSRESVIILKNVSKQYVIHHEKPTLVEKFYKGADEKFWALNKISLTIKKGERVGIIGPNGSGKTTLLKVISGITSPSSGSVTTRGKVVSLIDLEAGFHPDLTGYQNIFLNGMIIGMSKSDILKKLQNIISYAELDQFIDTPLFTYSQGMKLRLGFAITIHSEPDIIILDENLSVGDQYFQGKAVDTINTLVRKNRVTLVYVSHSLLTLRHLCTKIFWLQKGLIFRSGNTSLLTAYLQKYTD